MLSRINTIISQSGLSVRAFAIKCGLKQNTLSNQLNGNRELSLGTLMAIVKAFPEISADWLLCGEGEMLRSSNKEAERISKLIDTITTLQDAINTKSETIATLTEQIKKLENKK
ncbi:MAG: helix-turn-helix domain-containing protein [Muribaculaceae bacterium]